MSKKKGQGSFIPMEGGARRADERDGAAGKGSAQATPGHSVGGTDGIVRIAGIADEHLCTL